ncbi:aromatic-ring hydroxylase C-terminal domain-containing protein [Nonomuraea gerenzanensis]|uniref:aromatic-ring hydroxylase C-terminal domain-containing protein n=1 Tax=Nonomuraea gerenzanensis TaxID=93944 RepID=UPI001CD97CB0|nr:hypothetical protein [Nonomuraea gerenzanensis]UBU17156.1 hypothetical protein LCN96_19685 [Nonomuraea gerenzanensis]
MRPGVQVDALREVLSEVIGLAEAWRHFSGMMDGTAIDYAPGAAEPLVGRFVPEVRLAGVGSVAELLRDGRGLLIGLAAEGVAKDGGAAAGPDGGASGEPGALEAALAGHRDRVRPAWAEPGTGLGGDVGPARGGDGGPARGGDGGPARGGDVGPARGGDGGRDVGAEGPGALLVRPDGYVAWAGEPGAAAEALTTWFGPPAVR